MVRSVSHAQQNPRAVRQGEHAAARKRYIQILLRPYFRTSAAGLLRARLAAHKIREPTAAVLPICNAKSRGTDAFRAWCPAARLVRAVIYPYFSNSYDVLKALFMKALILRRQSAAGLRSVFFPSKWWFRTKPSRTNSTVLWPMHRALQAAFAL